MPRASDADRRSRRRGDDGRRSQRQRSHRKENGDKCDLQATAATRRLKRQRRASDEPRFVVARQRKQRNPTHTYARRAKKELNRGRLEMRRTKVFRVQDAVEVGLPGTRTIIRTYREVWQTRKTGKKDTRGRDIRRCVGKPKKTTAQARSDLKLHPAKLVRIMMKGGLQ